MLRVNLNFVLLVIVWNCVSQGRCSGQTVEDSDFALRCHSKGVVQCLGFDKPDDVSSRVMPAADGQIHGLLDSSVKASGAASLRFDIIPGLGANSSGSFALDFSHEYGSGEEFFVQWRQRFDHEMLTHVYQRGGGWKQAIIGEGGIPLRSAKSCSANEVVVQNNYHRGFPQIYHSCGAKDSKYEPLTPISPSDILLQDGVGCRYSQQKGPQCFRYVADQWMTFQVHIKIGTWYESQSGNYHRDSVVELWVAEENKPSLLVLSMPDYDLVHEKPDEKYGRIWLLTYNTDKDASEMHPIAHTWYDELIVSTLRIPDPGVATSNAPDSLTAAAAGQGVELKWRNNSELEAGIQVERCAGAIYECEATQSFIQLGTAPPHTDKFWDSGGTGKRYTYRVRATNKAGNSAYSNPASNVPRPPSDLVAEASKSQVHLSWSANALGISQEKAEFVVESCAGISCTNFAEVAHLPATETHYLHTGLVPGTVYCYRVRSTNAAGSWVTWDKAGTAYSNMATATPM